MRARILTLAVMVAIGACKKSKDDEGAADSTDTTEKAADAAADKPEPEPDAAPAVKAAIAPGDVDPETPIPVGELADRLAALGRGTKYRVVGYPAFFLGDHKTIKRELNLAAEGGQKKDKAVIKCRMASSAGEKELYNTKPVEVTGTLDGPALGDDDRYLRMKDCEIVGQADAYPADAPVVPGGEAAVAAKTLSDYYYGWIGTELSVVGDVWGVTTSRRPKSKGGGIMDIRVDVKGKDGKKRAGCHLEKEPPKLEGDQRKNVVFRGKFTELSGDKLDLEPCEMVAP